MVKRGCELEIINAFVTVVNPAIVPVQKNNNKNDKNLRKQYTMKSQRLHCVNEVHNKVIYKNMFAYNGKKGNNESKRE